MHKQLFIQDFAGYQEQETLKAEAKARKLTDVEIRNPAIAGALNKIANESGFDVATIEPSAEKWFCENRRKEMRAKSDYGRDINIEIPVADANIPFRGASKSFELKPTSYLEIDTQAAIRPDAILITNDDDEHFEGKAKTFVKRASTNLDNLRTDMERMRTAIRAKLQQLTDARIADLDNQKRIDGTRQMKSR
jgi:hypothetical protein